MTPEKAIDAAFSIATDIGANAIWHGERCNWLSQTSDIFLGSRLPAAGMCGPNVYDGTAGTAMFMAECYRATRDPIVKRYAEGAITHALSRVDDLPKRFALGVYTGRAGVAMAAVRVGEILEREDFVAQGRDLMTELFDANLDEICVLDVMVGLGGTIPAVLSILDHLPQERALDAVTKWGDVLLTQAKHSARGTSWDTMAEMQAGLKSIGMTAPETLAAQCCKPNLLGYGHGTSGIALALMELSETVGEVRFETCAARAVAYETSYYDDENQVWPDLRHDDPVNSTGATHVAWCHGAAGIGLSRLRMWELTHDVKYRHEAVKACAQTAAMTERNLFGETNWSLCHGVLGNLDLLMMARTADWTNHAPLVSRVLDKGYNEFIAKRRPWVYDAPSSEALPGLMLGTAGTGYAYLRYAAPDDVPSALLLGPAHKVDEACIHRAG